ncbi:MAG: ribonuclease H [Thermodesulfovibrionales bacterium]|nr:ribonuclease H [Thermodesulfovibrionales bacterium]
MIIEDALNIYTDGSSLSGPRRGGIGIRFITINDKGNEEIRDIELPGYKGATNNQMELYACKQALKEAQKLYALHLFKKIVIFTDSRYVADNYKTALFNWSRNKWRGRDNRPVLNADIWKDIIKCVRKTNHIVEFEWIKGHSKNIHNKAVDKLAKKSAKNAFNAPLSVVSVRRKRTTKSVEIGSVKMQGQRLKIRIITTEYLKTQRLFKYRYEVLSKGSKYFENVDFIFSNKSIRDGHCYIVSLNKITNNPTIIKVIEEIDCKTGEQL